MLAALTSGRERKLDREAPYGVRQLASVAWSASSSVQDPEAAMVAVRGLHTLLAHWTVPEQAQANAPAEDDPLPVVYPDRAIPEVLSALASIIVATGGSGQHQTCAQVLDVFSMALPLLEPDHQRIAVQQLRRVLRVASSHVCTDELDRALTALRRTLRNVGFVSCVDQFSSIESRSASRG